VNKDVMSKRCVRVFLALSGTRFPMTKTVAIAQELKAVLPSAENVVMLEGSMKIMATCHPLELASAPIAQWRFSNADGALDLRVLAVAVGSLQQSASSFALGALQDLKQTPAASSDKLKTVVIADDVTLHSHASATTADVIAQLKRLPLAQPLQKQLLASLENFASQSVKPAAHLAEVWSRTLDLIARDSRFELPVVTEVDDETGMPTADWTITKAGARFDVFFFLREREAVAVHMCGQTMPALNVVMCEDFLSIDAQAGAEKLLTLIELVFARCH
jgi:hypothetical protein